MTKLLASLAAFTALTAAASAADLPRRAAPPPVFTPVPVFTWTGAYFGINAGYAFDASDRNTGNTFAVPFPYAAPGTVASFRNRSQDGFSGGGQIGYNWQLTPAPASCSVSRRTPSTSTSAVTGTTPSSPGAGPGYYVTDPRGLSSLDFFGTVRGRLGYAFDRTLVYGNGGFAYGSGSADRSFGGYAATTASAPAGAVGGGVEYALPTDSFLNSSSAPRPVTLKVEGLYVNLDRNTRNQGAFVINAAKLPRRLQRHRRRSDEFAVVRAGLNYKFGSY